jgi:hypothetical protein
MQLFPLPKPHLILNIAHVEICAPIAVGFVLAGVSAETCAWRAITLRYWS